MARKIVCFSEAGAPIYDDEMMDNWFSLGMEILRRALIDYVDVYRKILRARSVDQVRKLQDQKSELENFFYSDWHEMLADTDGHWTVRKLREIAVKKEKELLRKQEERLVR